jgi:protocatechuate 3,4-dioxygenase beta subunit
MRDEEARLLAIRAADGELGESERRRLEAYCREHPEFVAFLEEERDSADRATEFCGAFGRPSEEAMTHEVLRRLERRRPRPILLFAAAAAVVLVAIAVLFAIPSDSVPHRVPPADREALVVLSGPPLARLSEDAYYLALGEYQVRSLRNALVLTDAGEVHLGPGRFDLSVDESSVRIHAIEGEARLRNEGSNETAAAGATASMRAVAPEAAVVQLRPGESDGPGVRLHGLVLDRTGSPLEGARIWVSTAGDPAVGEDVTKTAQDGRFTLEDLKGAVRYVGARAEGLAPSDLRVIHPPKQVEAELEFRLVDKGGALIGTVRSTSGSPVAGAQVFVGGGHFRNVPMRVKSPRGHALTHVRAELLITDEAGRFEYGGLPPEWNQLRVLAKGHASQLSFVRLPPGGKVDRQFVLQPSTTVFGTVHDETGDPVPNARIVFIWFYSAQPVAGVRSGADGRYRITDLPAGPVELRVDAGERGRAQLRIHTKVEAETEWNPVVSTGFAIEGLVVDEEGLPVRGARVWCRGAFRPAASYHAEAVTDDRGAFRIEGRRRIEHELWVWHPPTSGGGSGPPDGRKRVLADSGQVTLRLAAVRGAGSLAGRVLLPDGSPASRSRVRSWPHGEPGWSRTILTEEDGSFRIKGIKALTYKVEVHLDGHPTLFLEGIEVPPGGTRELGTLQYPRPGRVVCRLLLESGEPIQRFYPSLASLDARIYFTIEQKEAAGPAISEGLAPGRYHLHIGATGQIVEVEVEEGRDSELDVVLRQPKKVLVEVVREDGSRAEGVFLAVVDAEGRSVLGKHMVDLDEGQRPLWLVPGRYRISCEEESGKRGSVTVEVVEASAVLPVRLVLR